MSFLQAKEKYARIGREMWQFEKIKFAKWAEECEPKLRQLIKRNLLIKPSHQQRETETEGKMIVKSSKFKNCLLI